MRDLDYTNTRQQHYYFIYEDGRDDNPWKYTVVSHFTHSLHTSHNC